MKNVSKRGGEHGGDMKDAPCYKQPIKITKINLKKVLEVKLRSKVLPLKDHQYH